MKKLVMSALAFAAVAAFAEKVALKIQFPPPHSSGTPKEIKSDNLEPDPGPGKFRPPIMVEPEYTKKLTTEDTKVTTSEEAVTGENEYVVDGDKTPDATSMLQLPGGVQWVQLDLGAEHDISAVCVWHDQGDERVYKDVIMQISNDPKFLEGVTTIFNNDHDDSAARRAPTRSTASATKAVRSPRWSTTSPPRAAMCAATRTAPRASR